MYLVLFGVVMAALGGSFATIKIRQRALNSKEVLVNTKLSRAQEVMNQFEELQTKRKAMIKAALTTADLLEAVPRSILLASLTNNLPTGVSLLRLKLVQKEPKITKTRQGGTPANKYKAAQAKKSAKSQPEPSREKLLETHIDIEGIAPSDLQLAAYIGRLRSSNLLDNVALVETKEQKIEDTPFRQFKLTAMLRKDIHLTKDDIETIRTKGQSAIRVF
jgi:Tfp pilus assembly protein PilN